MKRQEFEKEKQLRKDAIRLFPSFFKSDFSLDEEKTLTELEERYKNFGIPRTNSLVLAHDFLADEIAESKKISDLESDIARELYESYRELIYNIKEYGFNPRYENSYGDTQNKNNENILFELISLRNNIIMALNEIDQYLKKLSKEINNSETIYLNNKMKEMKCQLDAASTELVRSEFGYHDVWNIVNRGRDYSGYGDFNELGVLKAEWRKNRNNACRTFIETYGSLIIIGNHANKMRMGKSFFSQNLIDDNIEHIKSGPNYYCYLSQDEISFEVNKNRARKRERKKAN